MNEQPAPIPNNSRPVWELVVEDMQSRDRLGRERYGVPLQAGNGRDALRDAYEEALDHAVYLRQAIVEREAADRLQAAAPDLLAALEKLVMQMDRINAVTREEEPLMDAARAAIAKARGQSS